MRTAYLLPLLALIVADVPAQSPATPLAIVVDVDSPLANSDAARLPEQALADLARSVPPVCFELTAQTAQRDVRADGVPCATLTFRPRKYNGVSVSFSEAIEILRKNEAVRDAVVARECPTGGCGGAVNAALNAVIEDTERETAQKLRHVAKIAASEHVATLILVTAGWPYRDEQQLGLDEAVRDIRASGTTLVVLRAPSLVNYQGIVKDASLALALRTSMTFVAMTGEGGGERAREALARHIPAVAQPDAAVVDVAPDEPALTPAEDVPSTIPPPADAILGRAAGYVALFEHTFSAVIWREHYLQEDRARRRFNSSGGSFAILRQTRQLESELLFVWVPAEATWIAVRDVIAVDGKPRAAASRRLPALLKQSSVSVDQLRRLSAENGRFNIGEILRTFNEPTLALLFLGDRYRQRFSFSRAKDEIVDGRRAAVYDFVETVKPTIIQDKDRNVPARGTVWIDPDTGQVLQTLLGLSDQLGGVAGRMVVKYRSDEKFNVLVPSEMRETYLSSTGEEVTTIATYSDFRQFETKARLIFRS